MEISFSKPKEISDFRKKSIFTGGSQYFSIFKVSDQVNGQGAISANELGHSLPYNHSTWIQILVSADDRCV